jgi:hypothetical protein
VVFRGCHLNQLRHGLRCQLTTAPRWSLLLAFVTSQGVVPLIHAPSRLVGGEFTPAQTVRPGAPPAVRLGNPAGGRLLSDGNPAGGGRHPRIHNTPTSLVGSPDARVPTAN